MATNFFDPTYMEACFAALLTQLQMANANLPPSAGFSINSFARTFKAPDDVPVAGQPSLFLVPGPMHVDQKEFALAKWLFTAVALIYLRGDLTATNPNPLPWQQANYIVWAIMNSLAAPPGPYQKQTLGGLVTHCWIEGEVAIEVAAEQIVIGMPIYLLAGDVG